MVLNYRDKSGARKQKWISTHLQERGNKKKALAMLDATLEEYKASQIEPIFMDFADYLEKWLPTMEHKVRRSTYRAYVGNMTNHIIPYFKQHRVELQKLRPTDLERYYEEMTQAGSSMKADVALSNLTIKHHHQNISKALADAVHDGLIIANPASAARTPKAKQKKFDFYTTEQIKQLFILFKGSPIEIPVILGALYGLRRGEVLGLRWENVDFENKCFTVRETLQQGVVDNYVDDPKIESSYRTLPFVWKVEEILRQHKETQEQRRALLGAYYQPSDYVCTWSNGVVISPNYLTRTFHRRLQDSKLPVIRFHDLRHSVASNLLHAGRSIPEVQEWLGHASSVTTMKFYAHVDLSYTRETGDAVSAMIADN